MSASEEEVDFFGLFGDDPVAAAPAAPVVPAAAATNWSDDDFGSKAPFLL